MIVDLSFIKNFFISNHLSILLVWVGKKKKTGREMGRLDKKILRAMTASRTF
jgi:hypothetical protein